MDIDDDNDEYSKKKRRNEDYIDDNNDNVNKKKRSREVMEKNTKFQKIINRFNKDKFILLNVLEPTPLILLSKYNELNAKVLNIQNIGLECLIRNIVKIHLIADQQD